MISFHQARMDTYVGGYVRDIFTVHFSTTFLNEALNVRKIHSSYAPRGFPMLWPSLVT